MAEVTLGHKSDDADERKAHRTTWPEATQLLCIFPLPPVLVEMAHVHGISMEDRQPIMRIIRSLVYNRNEVELEHWYGLKPLLQKALL